jgi:hypothetical protein
LKIADKALYNAKGHGRNNVQGSAMKMTIMGGAKQNVES